MHTIKIKRIYEEPKKSDGYRILVDKLWPRGMKKEKAVIDGILKEAKKKTVTLLFSAKETEHSNAIALLDILLAKA